MKPRRGFRKELNEIFDAAEEMCGCGDPDSIAEKRSHVRKIQEELYQLLRSARNE